MRHCLSRPKSSANELRAPDRSAKEMIQCRSSRKRDEIPRHTLFFPPPPAPNDVGAARGIIKPSSYRSRDMLAGGLKETRVSNLVRGRLVFLSLRATSITLQVFFFLFNSAPQPFHYVGAFFERLL